ncbi:MAG: SipW-dependent-type signal peptide-containing protein, partial [Dehalococcoidia bacterium]|nr:SipW-dependent-type signal peptide-containing protein [Dehalococcoidia bacterium]
MKKILGLTIAFMLLISMGSIGTWAYFQDTETSTG